MNRASALAIWLVLQTGTLAVGAMRVPLWARSGAVPQHLALEEVLCVQFGATALLFPSLLRGSNGVAAVLTALPFIQLAALLTSTPATASVAVSIHLLLWITGLSAWANALRSKTSMAVCVAVLSGITLGGPVLTYLIRDFSEKPDHSIWQLPLVFNPIGATLRQASDSSIEPALGTAPALIFLAGLIVFVVRQRRNRLAPSYPQVIPPRVNSSGSI